MTTNRQLNVNFVCSSTPAKEISPRYLSCGIVYRGFVSFVGKARFRNELKANVTIRTIPKLRGSHQKALQ